MEQKKNYLAFGTCLALGVAIGLVMDKLAIGIAIGCALGVYYERKKKGDKKDDI